MITPLTQDELLERHAKLLQMQEQAAALTIDQMRDTLELSTGAVVNTIEKLKRIGLVDEIYTGTKTRYRFVNAEDN